MSLAELQAITVAAFPSSIARPVLFGNFTTLLNEIEAVSLPCGVWVDGSFVTEKVDPEDIDVFVCMSAALASVTSPAQAALIARVNDDDGFIERVDSFAFFELELGSPDEGTEYDDRSGWAHHCGTERNSGWCKGIALIESGGSGVGFHIHS